VATLNYSAIAALHNLQLSTAHAVCCVFTSHSLVTVSGGGGGDDDDDDIRFIISDLMFS
jgi:hypothetical protein